MNKFLSLLSLTTLLCGISNVLNAQQTSDSISKESANRFQFGGYGEAVYTYNYFSNKYLRYTDAQTYKNDDGHGRIDLPHVVLWFGYDFGHNWTLGTEIEFEHGGTGSAVDIEEEEAGEYESEIEKGGEVALEQFWIQKSFSDALNIKMGHIVVPVGATNQNHLPTEFFSNYRSEGESTIIPCTWHETGLSLWGKLKNWRYEVMLLPGLDSDRFNSRNWIGNGGGSPYEFKIANSLAGAMRIDNYSINNLCLSISGYLGNTFKNTLNATDGSKYQDVKGTVVFGTFDFGYEAHDLIVRGNFDYGHLSDSELITKYNMSMRKDSPSPKQAVGSDAVTWGIEAGYNILPVITHNNLPDQSLYLFACFEYYDSMFKTEGSIRDYGWCGRKSIAAGINYKPVKQIVIKGEYNLGLLDEEYNNEPAVSIGIAYSGLFINKTIKNNNF